LESGQFFQFVGERSVPRFESGIFSQADESGGTPTGGDLIVKQGPQTKKNSRAWVVIRNKVSLRIVVATESQLRVVNHDFQVLLDVLILLLGQPGFEFFEGLA